MMIKYIIPFVLFSLSVTASPQMPDYLIYEKDTIATYNLMLEQYLQKKDKTDSDKLFGLSFRDGSSLNCWRGYQAIYRIENGYIYLVDIINCGELENGKIDKTESLRKMSAIFGEKVINGKVKINWFNGKVNFPLTNELLRWDGVFYKIFEKEKVLSIVKGKVIKSENVKNYVDDPNRIDRKDKKMISDILFKQLEKSTWINPNNFDCSSKYVITIDEKGNVSKANMRYTEEEIEMYYDTKEEYIFCVNKVFDVLKSLKFDIIKNKGIPISENIYIEIWVKDGKIENWTD